MHFGTVRQTRNGARRWTLASVVIICLGSAFNLSFGQNSVPFVNQPLVPGATAPGSAGFTLTINGTGFASGATVEWNGTPLVTTFVSNGQLTAAVPVVNVAAAGTAIVTVLNPGTTAASNPVFFPVVKPSSSVLYSHALNSPIILGAKGGKLSEPLSIGTGDFNGDGKLDLVTGIQEGTNNPGYIDVRLGNGDGTFTLIPSSPATGSCPCAIAVGDINGDGKSDIAVANFDDNTVSIFLGHGDGTFVEAPGSPVSVGSEPSGLVLADFNGDQNLDLAVANSSDNTLTILFGNGDGTFAANPPIVANGASPFGMAVGDFNNDGKIDLAVTNYVSNSVSILLGNGDGTFTPAPMISATAGPVIFAADFNGDGKLDLALSNRSDSTAIILLGRGDGTFTPVNGCCGIPQTFTHTQSMAVGDFNGDGKLDLALGILNVGFMTPIDYIVVLTGNGDGTFSTSDFSLILPQDVFGTTTGDFNSDGTLDFVTASNPVNEISVLTQSASVPSPDFSILASTTSARVKAGGTAVYSIQITSLNGFLGNVSFTCTGAPLLSQCPVPSPTFLFDSVVASFNLSVTTTAPTLPPLHTAASTLSGRAGFLWAGLFAPLFALALFPFGRSYARASSVAMAVLCIAFLPGCGGHSSSPPPPSGTPPGTYTLKVTATSGTITHSTTVTLTVN